MLDSTGPDRGVYYLAVGWTLTGIAIVVVALRLYSRILLTRSAGSDDFAIIFSLILTIVGEIGDAIAASHGLGRHIWFLDNGQISTIIKWAYIDLIIVFISFFFIRASVMLFTLRLLPITKEGPRKIIYVAFFLNFAITVIAVVSYGIKCRPFTAIYNPSPGSHCIPTNVIIATQQTNGILACIIDITTALIPEFLLHHLQMRRRTKVILNTIFGLGLITAALSIGRAATSNGQIWTTDASWRIMPSNTFSLIEEKLGIIFASAPALRQLVAYLLRTKTILPSHRRQEPGADFVGMRKRVKLRDIFWYHKPPPGPSQMPMTDHTNKHGGPRYVDAEVANSALDGIGDRIKAIFSFGSSSRAGSRRHLLGNGSSARRLRSEDTEHVATGQADTVTRAERGLTSTTDSNRIRGKCEAWGLPAHEEKRDSGDNRSSGPVSSSATFLQTNSSAGAGAELPKQEPSSGI